MWGLRHLAFCSVAAQKFDWIVCFIYARVWFADRSRTGKSKRLSMSLLPWNSYLSLPQQSSRGIELPHWLGCVKPFQVALVICYQFCSSASVLEQAWDKQKVTRISKCVLLLNMQKSRYATIKHVWVHSLCCPSGHNCWTENWIPTIVAKIIIELRAHQRWHTDQSVASTVRPRTFNENFPIHSRKMSEVIKDFFEMLKTREKLAYNTCLH